MPELKNLKHEILARNIIKQDGNLTKAYIQTYPDSSEESARSHVHRMVANGVGVRERVLEIMQQSGLSLPRLTTKLNKHVDSEDERVSLQATQFGIKTYTDTDVTGDTHNHIHINAKELESLPESETLGKLRDLLR